MGNPLQTGLIIGLAIVAAVTLVVIRRQRRRIQRRLDAQAVALRILCRPPSADDPGRTVPKMRIVRTKSPHRR